MLLLVHQTSSFLTMQRKHHVSEKIHLIQGILFINKSPRPFVTSISGIWHQSEHFHHISCVVTYIFLVSVTKYWELRFCHTSEIQTNIEVLKPGGKQCPTFQIYFILFQFYAGVEGWKSITKRYSKNWHVLKAGFIHFVPLFKIFWDLWNYFSHTYCHYSCLESPWSS